MKMWWKNETKKDIRVYQESSGLHHIFMSFKSFAYSSNV